ncbi:DUF167 domain-containing protein [Desulfovibrio subterraneus]|jgi:Uncharacterized conserved protein|uniref:UPF0235 protein DSM101010T_21110 n=1 Tax=Desulfovibrio subterraneus TaxID=2718620 RepID=A0A7J0BJ69_9BACT|nr:DUF167 domain-containing protein [Desulfovibrio subterraneus]WBF67882.1 DUF167 domain-containing protein [Desulfovibrio subterraneus]GFM33746.1 UPF0235 protein [Desulfovibrio subterraneus]
MALPEYIVPEPDGSHMLLVWAQPGAKKNEVVGLHQGRLKIRLNAPAVDNKANKALLEFVAKLLSVRASRLELVAGQTSRQKKIRIESAEEPVWNSLITGVAE